MQLHLLPILFRFEDKKLVYDSGANLMSRKGQPLVKIEGLPGTDKGCFFDDVRKSLREGNLPKNGIPYFVEMLTYNGDVYVIVGIRLPESDSKVPPSTFGPSLFRRYSLEGGKKINVGRFRRTGINTLIVNETLRESVRSIYRAKMHELL